MTDEEIQSLAQRIRDIGTEIMGAHVLNAGQCAPLFKQADILKRSISEVFYMSTVGDKK